MAEPQSLLSLLRLALGGLEHAYGLQGAGHDGVPSLDLWANLLRVLDVDGVARRELPELTRLSKRAVRVRISSATRHAWTEENKPRGIATVRLTKEGALVADRWKSIEQAAEDNWQNQVGLERFETLRNALEVLVGTLPLEYSHYPARYGTADARITGGSGEDWTPVRRQQGDTVSQVTMCALLSQAAVAYAADYEEASPVALTISTGIIRRIPPDGQRLRHIGMRTDLSAMQRHGFVAVQGGGADARVFLTAAGQAVSDAHEQRVRAVEESWRKRFADETITHLRQALRNVTDHSEPSTPPT